MTRRGWAYLVGCFVFGALVEVMKARGSWAFDARAELGNLSAPWLLVGLFAGMLARRVGRGAAAGLVATYAALLGFYLAETVMFAGQLGDHGGLVGDTAWVFRAGLVWFVFGTLSGPVMGAVGGWLSRRPIAVWALAGLLLVGEPLVLLAFANRPLPLPRPLNLDWSFEWTAIYAVEVLAGLALIGATLALRRRPPIDRPRAPR